MNVMNRLMLSLSLSLIVPLAYAKNESALCYTRDDTTTTSLVGAIGNACNLNIRQVQANRLSNHESIDVSALNQGLYLLRLYNGYECSSVRFVLNK